MEEKRRVEAILEALRETTAAVGTGFFAPISSEALAAEFPGVRIAETRIVSEKPLTAEEARRLKQVILDSLEKTVGSESTQKILSLAEELLVLRGKRETLLEAAGRPLNAGIPGFESLLPGLPAMSATLLAGQPGSGKTIFCKQFIFQGLRENQPCIFVSTTENKEMILSTMKARGMNAAPFFEKGLLKIVDIYSWIARTAVRHEPGVYFSGSPSDLNDVSLTIAHAVSDLKEEVQIKRLVFDSVSTLFFHNPIESVVKFVEVLRGRLNSEVFSSLLVLEEGLHPQQVFNTLNYLCDGMIQLIQEEDKKFVRAPRMKGMPSSFAKVEYFVVGEGIVIGKPFHALR